jgi:hypothetical protein
MEGLRILLSSGIVDRIDTWNLILSAKGKKHFSTLKQQQQREVNGNDKVRQGILPCLLGFLVKH